MASPPPTPTLAVPFTGFDLSLPAATVVEADPQPYSNTREIMAYNADADFGVYMQCVILDAGGALPLPGAVTAANSVYIAPGVGVTLCIDTEGGRNAFGTVAFWGAYDGGSRMVLVFKAANPAGGSVSITYVQSTGGSSGFGCGGG